MDIFATLMEEEKRRRNPALTYEDAPERWLMTSPTEGQMTERGENTIPNVYRGPIDPPNSAGPRPKKRKGRKSILEERT